MGFARGARPSPFSTKSRVGCRSGLPPGFSQLRLLPNLLSVSRIAAAPLLAWTVLLEQTPLLALGVAVAAALTDLLDGLAARVTGQVTELGAILDPLADKIFILTALWLLWGDGVIQGSATWAALLILWREILISGLRGRARLSGLRAPVSAAAKFKTAAQFSALIMLFASRLPHFEPDVLHAAGTGLLWLSAVLALYSGAEYFAQAWRRSWT